MVAAESEVCYDAREASQEATFELVGRPVGASCLAGYNGAQTARLKAPLRIGCREIAAGRVQVSGGHILTDLVVLISFVFRLSRWYLCIRPRVSSVYCQRFAITAHFACSYILMDVRIEYVVFDI
jgi:hypothetical protein